MTTKSKFSSDRGSSTRIERIILGCILLVAAVVRLWRFPEYVPCFWDEAKYLTEVEGIIPFFGVNPGAFALLKLGYDALGTSAYPQIITAAVGVLTVLGCYLLGRRMLREPRESSTLGLLMAGQAALMPYFVSYSRHALATGFALCACVFALWLYVARDQRARRSGASPFRAYLRYHLPAAGMLALVPACSFNLLLPTLVLFVVLEIVTRRNAPREFRDPIGLPLTLLSGAVLFLVVPVAIAGISGYSGWWGRALALSAFHAEIRTMRLAFHFLYPVHLWYFCGPVFIALTAAGAAWLLVFRKSRSSPAVGKTVNVIMGCSFAVYLLFFGMLSHLQSARLYALTLPALVFASSISLLRVRDLRPKLGRVGAWVAGIALFGSLGYGSLDYIAKSCALRTMSDLIMRQLKPNQLIYTDAKDPIGYCTYTSPYSKRVPYNVNSLLSKGAYEFDPRVPPFLVLEDAIDAVAVVATRDKYDLLGPLDSVQVRLQSIRDLAKVADPVAAAYEDFFATPYFYLEDVYSWRSYAYIRELIAHARDSVFVYQINVDLLQQTK